MTDGGARLIADAIKFLGVCIVRAAFLWTRSFSAEQFTHWTSV